VPFAQDLLLNRWQKRPLVGSSRHYISEMSDETNVLDARPPSVPHSILRRITSLPLSHMIAYACRAISPPHKWHPKNIFQIFFLDKACNGKTIIAIFISTSGFPYPTFIRSTRILLFPNKNLRITFSAYMMAQRHMVLFSPSMAGVPCLCYRIPPLFCQTQASVRL